MITHKTVAWSWAPQLPCYLLILFCFHQSNVLKNYIHTMSPHSYFLSHPKITLILAKVFSAFSMLTKSKDHLFITLPFIHFLEARDTVKHSLLHTLASLVFYDITSFVFLHFLKEMTPQISFVGSCSSLQASKVRAPQVSGLHLVLCFLPNPSRPHEQH